MKIFTNIQELVQVRSGSTSALRNESMNELPTIKNAFLVVENGKIHSFGEMNKLTDLEPIETINCAGKSIFPGWVDSHTHLVFARSREGEFLDKIHGLTYEEIAARGGGILNSAKHLQQMHEDELYEHAAKRLSKIIRQGSSCIEIKSGYGLNKDSELKILKVIKRLKDNFPIIIKSTFLGAHAVPLEFKNNKSGYIDLIINEMLPEISENNLADYIDIFCEKGYFSAEDTRRVLEAGKAHGLRPKIHSNQFNSIGGIEAALEYDAVSVDHLEVMKDEEIKLLANKETVAVGLPNCSFYLGIGFAPAKKIIKEGGIFALASDYNPGSAPSGNMNLVVSLACIKMKLTPQQAINAATINAAHALESEQEVGSIAVGKRADFFITSEISSVNYLPYSFGENQIESVYIKGEKF